MLQIPSLIFTSFRAHLIKKNIPTDRFQEYKKWLHFFLDFCEKYQIEGDNTQKLRKYINKLKDKNQSEDQRRFAYHPVSLYFDMLKLEQGTLADSIPPPQPVPRYQTQIEVSTPQLNISRKAQYSEAGYQEKSDSPEWDDVLEKLAGEIKVRHYSRNTLKTYAHWSRQFQSFLKNKSPQDLSTVDVKEYLTYLAVKCKVAASTQNQAFNSLLFLFRYALKREFGELRDVPRAKKSLYIPIVLSMSEIEAILKQLYYPYNLFVKVLFGCGLRLFEGLQIRVGDFNFDDGKLLVHGKGK